MGTRTIIIGDVHGCHDELVDLLDRVGFADGDTLVSVGDLVDRGPDPGAVLELFRRTPGAIVVCGNHERKHVRGLLTHSQQITRLQLEGYGRAAGATTPHGAAVPSFGAPGAEPGPTGGSGYEEAVRWMSTLPYFYETDEVRVVHAGLIPGVPLAECPPEILSGTTSGEERLRKRLGGRWWHELYDEDKPVVFGHHVVQEPLVVDDRVFGIDTGACHGWSLTALVLPERRLVSVPARADHWAATRRRWQVPVLRSRPWASMSFEEIERRVGELRTDDPEALAFLDAVRAWAAAVRAAIPALATVLEAEVERLLAEVGPDELGRRSAVHPAGSWLVRWHAGRLQRDHLGCASPDAVRTLASALGHEALVPPAP